MKPTRAQLDEAVDKSNHAVKTLTYVSEFAVAEKGRQVERFEELFLRPAWRVTPIDASHSICAAYECKLFIDVGQKGFKAWHKKADAETQNDIQMLLGDVAGRGVIVHQKDEETISVTFITVKEIQRHVEFKATELMNGARKIYHFLLKGELDV